MTILTSSPGSGQQVAAALGSAEAELVSFITGRCEEWRNATESNYGADWDRYDRLWRMIHDGKDSHRKSERSKIVTPIISEAIDGVLSEVIDATFGYGPWVDIEDDDPDMADTQAVLTAYRDRADMAGVPDDAEEVALIGLIYGTGFGETYPDTKEIVVPGAVGNQVGVHVTEKVILPIRPLTPRQVRIDPTARSLEESEGVGVAEPMTLWNIRRMQRAGTYRKVPIYGSTTTSDESQPDTVPRQGGVDTVECLRWFGQVPKECLQEFLDEKKAGEGDNALSRAVDQAKASDTEDDDEGESEGGAEYDDTETVEAVVHIVNGRVLLAQEQPYMARERPIKMWRVGRVPGRLHGRGLAERGNQMQRGADAQLRAHIDALGFTGSPMFGLDATRLPKGFNFTVAPGRNILFQGPPKDGFERLNMGTSDPAILTTAETFERMGLQAMGAGDAGNIPSLVRGNADANTLSLALAGLIKRHKSILRAFQRQFLQPTVRFQMICYMQFDPQVFPPKDFSFRVAGTMGILAREYEQQNLLRMMSTLGPTSPLVPLLLAEIVRFSSVQARDRLYNALQQAAAKMQQPDPVEQQRIQIEMGRAVGEVQKLAAETQRIRGQAEQDRLETALLPQKVQAEVIRSLAINTNPGSQEFEQRARIAELMLKEEDIKSNERIAHIQALSKGRAPQ